MEKGVIMERKVFAVTGAKGFIPGHLIEYLRTQPHKEIRQLDIIDGHDVTRIGEMTRTLLGVDVVFHLATLPLELSLVNPYLVASDLYMMSLTLCELCRQGIFKTLIQVSSSEAYGSAVKTPMKEDHPMAVRTLYAAGKASSDLLLQAYHTTFGIDAAIARPFNNYGPGQVYEKGGVISKTIYRVLKGERPIIYGDGSNVRDYIYVKDTVRGIYEVYKNPKTRGKVINISASQAYCVKDLVKMICRLAKVRYNPIFKPARTADVAMHVADNTLAKKLLGFEAKVKLEEGLQRTIAWYRKYLK